MFLRQIHLKYLSGVAPAIFFQSPRHWPWLPSLTPTSRPHGRPWFRSSRPPFVSPGRNEWNRVEDGVKVVWSYDMFRSMPSMFGGFYGEDRDLDEFCSAKVGENWNTAGILMDHDLPTRSCGATEICSTGFWLSRSSPRPWANRHLRAMTKRHSLILESNKD